MKMWVGKKLWLWNEVKDDLRISKREGLRRGVSDGRKEGEKSEEGTVFR